MTIILCCGSRGRTVVVGDVASDPVPGQPVEIRNARMILSWPSGSLFGLAANGPPIGASLTVAVPRIVETVWQEWVEVTPIAAAKIRAHKATL